MPILDPVLNFAIGTVSTGYDGSATTVVLTAGHGAHFPATANGAYNVTWWNITDYPNPEDDPNVEIVRVTTRSTDTLTVTRAQEGTGASTKNTSAKVYKMVLSPTKKLRDDIETAITVATGAEVDTGTDDVKKVTAKAIEDSAYVKATYADNKVSDTAYDATTWDAVTTIAPSKNAVRDKIEAMVIPVKASGAEINTGTDDAKFVTAKAIADSSVSLAAKSETLTNKTLTAPAITTLNLSTAVTDLSIPSAKFAAGYPYFSGLTETYVNLSTSPVNVFGGAAVGTASLFLSLMNIAGDTATFQINSALDAGVQWKFNHVLGANCAITESSEGVFAITGLGDGVTYTISLSTGASQMTIKASATQTGNTKLSIFAIRFS